MTLKINNAVIHKLTREDSEPSVIHPAPASLDANDASLFTLVNDVHKVYGDRAGKSYGKFDPALTPVSSEPHLLKLKDEADADFLAITLDLMKILKSKVDSQNFATGGHVLIFDYNANDKRWFVVAIVNSAAGTMVDENFQVVDAPYLDTNGLRFAGRVNFTDWQAGTERYISFLRGKSSDVSLYFQNFIGCTTVAQDLNDTKNLVAAVKQFASDQQLADEAKEALLAEVDRFAREKAEDKQPLSLDELANKVWSNEPEALKNAFNESDPPISDGFIPRKRGLEGLVRFKAKTKKWKLEFEREAVQDGTILFNPEEGTVTIQNLPDEILASLREEFVQNAATDDDPAH
ncbi:nucleoid-associated protein [Oceanisphaera sp. KMM 10153]|uniref:nucleoid-associated protein n=1 Tax=Oceanisphaera submarina TaxID=3390193 RepID=UPI0039755B1B